MSFTCIPNDTGQYLSGRRCYPMPASDREQESAQASAPCIPCRRRSCQPLAATLRSAYSCFQALNSAPLRPSTGGARTSYVRKHPRARAGRYCNSSSATAVTERFAPVSWRPSLEPKSLPSLICQRSFPSVTSPLKRGMDKVDFTSKALVFPPSFRDTHTLTHTHAHRVNYTPREHLEEPAIKCDLLAPPSFTVFF